MRPGDVATADAEPGALAGETDARVRSHDAEEDGRLRQDGHKSSS